MYKVAISYNNTVTVLADIHFIVFVMADRLSGNRLKREGRPPNLEGCMGTQTHLKVKKKKKTEGDLNFERLMLERC